MRWVNKSQRTTPFFHDGRPSFAVLSQKWSAERSCSCRRLAPGDVKVSRITTHVERKSKRRLCPPSLDRPKHGHRLSHGCTALIVICIGGKFAFVKARSGWGESHPIVNGYANTVRMFDESVWYLAAEAAHSLIDTYQLGNSVGLGRRVLLRPAQIWPSLASSIRVHSDNSLINLVPPWATWSFQLQSAMIPTGLQNQSQIARSQAERKLLLQTNESTWQCFHTDWPKREIGRVVAVCPCSGYASLPMDSILPALHWHILRPVSRIFTCDACAYLRRLLVRHLHICRDAAAAKRLLFSATQVYSPPTELICNDDNQWRTLTDAGRIDDRPKHVVSLR